MVANYSPAAESIWVAYAAHATVIGGFATGIALGVAIAALFAGYFQIQHNARLAHEISALDSYNKYIELCVEMTEYSCSILALKTIKIKNFREIEEHLSVESERYLWFVSFLLITCEKILASLSKRRKFIKGGSAARARNWEEVLTAQLRYHEPLLKEVWPSWKRFYSEELRSAVASTFDWVEKERKAGRRGW